MITHAPSNAPSMPEAMRQAMRREPADAMHVRDVRDVLTIFLTVSDQLTVGNAHDNRIGKSAMASENDPDRPWLWHPMTGRRAAWTDKIGFPGWRENRPFVDPAWELVLAHCAFCGLDGYTPSDWAL